MAKAGLEPVRPITKFGFKWGIGSESSSFYPSNLLPHHSLTTGLGKLAIPLK